MFKGVLYGSYGVLKWLQIFLKWGQIFLKWLQIFLNWGQGFLKWLQNFLKWGQKFIYIYISQKVMSERLNTATSYMYGLMRRAFDMFDVPQQFANAVEKEIAIRDDRRVIEAERDRQRIAREAEAEANRGLISRLIG